MPSPNTSARRFHDQQEAGVETAATNIARYCARCWGNARLAYGEYEDATQMVMEALLERVPDQRTWASALNEKTGGDFHELVRIIDMVKKRFLRAKGHVELPVLAARDERPAHERKLLWEQVCVLLGRFTPRQRRILELTHEGWSVPEIAAELRTTTDRVSDEKYKTIRRLREILAVAA
ncbi:MAG TPA: sigma-70 family RNA polymerase sigma factor [Candidatus Peribacteria bacterium]|nr:sigma-70 family RNA polymerase sigma factor [Candidatus Peribacteria bacterium]